MPGATIEQGQTIGVFALSPPRTFGLRFTARLMGAQSE